MDKLDLKILIGLHRNVSLLDKMTSNIVSKHGLTFSQFMVLEALYSRGNMTVGEVRDHILSSVGTISIIVDNLVRKNYVRRITSEKDRRVCILSLTDEGHELVKKIVPINDRMIFDYMSVLNNDEKNSLLYLLKKIGGRLDEKDSSK